MEAKQNSAGIHALVFAGATTEEVRSVVNRIKAAGFDLVELSLHGMQTLDTAARSDIEAADMEVTCSRGLGFDADVPSEDTAVVKRGVAILRESPDAAEALGARVVTGALYSALGKYGSALSDRGRANAVAALQELARDAARRAICLGLEVCNRYETNVTDTAAQALRLADDAGEGNVMIHLDTYRMNIEERDFVSPVLEVRDRLGYVHVGENHRGYLGSGPIDFTTFFRALAGINYKGPITFESFSSAVASQSLSDDLAVRRSLWEDGDNLASKAQAFLDTQMVSVAAACHVTDR